MDRTRGPVVSMTLLVAVGGPIALFCTFVLAFASDACGLSGGGNWACSDTVVTATFVLPIAGLVAGIALNAIAIAAVTRHRSSGGWLFLAWTVPVAAVILGFTLAGSMELTTTQPLGSRPAASDQVGSGSSGGSMPSLSRSSGKSR